MHSYNTYLICNCVRTRPSVKRNVNNVRVHTVPCTVRLSWWKCSCSLFCISDYFIDSPPPVPLSSVRVRVCVLPVSRVYVSSECMSAWVRECVRACVRACKCLVCIIVYTCSRCRDAVRLSCTSSYFCPAFDISKCLSVPNAVCRKYVFLFLKMYLCSMYVCVTVRWFLMTHAISASRVYLHAHLSYESMKQNIT